jgi:hypothetical protein
MRLAIYMPLYIVWTIGIVLSLTSWRKHPQVSMLALAGLIIQLFQAGAGVLFSFWVTTQMAGASWSSRPFDVGMALNISTFVQMCLSSIAWAFILVAIFLWRHQPGRILGRDGHYLPEGFMPDAAAGLHRGRGNVHH